MYPACSRIDHVLDSRVLGPDRPIAPTAENDVLPAIAVDVGRYTIFVVTGIAEREDGVRPPVLRVAIEFEAILVRAADVVVAVFGEPVEHLRFVRGVLDAGVNDDALKARLRRRGPGSCRDCRSQRNERQEAQSR